MLREDHTKMLCMLAWDTDYRKELLPGRRDCLPRTALLGANNAVTLPSQLGREVLTQKNNKWLNFSLKCEYRLLINTIQRVGWLSPARNAATAPALLVGVRHGQGLRTLVTWDLEIKIINSLCGALHQCCWPWSRSPGLEIKIINSLFVNTSVVDLGHVHLEIKIINSLFVNTSVVDLGHVHLEIKIINSLCGALHQCCWPWSRSPGDQDNKQPLWSFTPVLLTLVTFTWRSR